MHHYCIKITEIQLHNITIDAQQQRLNYTYTYYSTSSPFPPGMGHYKLCSVYASYEYGNWECGTGQVRMRGERKPSAPIWSLATTLSPYLWRPLVHLAQKPTLSSVTLGNASWMLPRIHSLTITSDSDSLWLFRVAMHQSAILGSLGGVELGLEPLLQFVSSL